MDPARVPLLTNLYGDHLPNHPQFLCPQLSQKFSHLQHPPPLLQKGSGSLPPQNPSEVCFILIKRTLNHLLQIHPPLQLSTSLILQHPHLPHPLSLRNSWQQQTRQQQETKEGIRHPIYLTTLPLLPPPHPQPPPFHLTALRYLDYTPSTPPLFHHIPPLHPQPQPLYLNPICYHTLNQFPQRVPFHPLANSQLALLFTNNILSLPLIHNSREHQPGPSNYCGKRTDWKPFRS